MDFTKLLVALFSGGRSRFANQVTPTFHNSNHAAAEAPIGIALETKFIDEKFDKLKDAIQGVDLRHITPEELGLLGVKLYAAGEISDISVGSLIMGNSDLDARNVKFDAIDYYEKGMQQVTSDRDLRSAVPLYSDTLNTLYNLDTLINRKKGQTVDTRINLASLDFPHCLSI